MPIVVTFGYKRESRRRNLLATKIQQATRKGNEAHRAGREITQWHATKITE